jgi:DNA invertase Pin-like site-specific DNA recombinase
MKGMRVGYRRVSSVDQTMARQLDGVQVDKMFEDYCSGKDTDRPQLQLALEFLREGDTLIVHSLDRLARNLMDLRRIVTELTGRGVVIEFMKERMTFTNDENPMNTLLLSVMGAFAEFERTLIKERQREGIALAKAKGVYKGRNPSLTSAQIEELRTAFNEQKEPRSALAKRFGISRQTLYIYIKDTDHPTRR